LAGRASALTAGFAFVLAVNAALVANSALSLGWAAPSIVVAAFGLYRSVVAQLTHAGRQTLVLPPVDADLQQISARLAKKVVFAESASAALGTSIVLLLLAALVDR
jgi:hypothetical protein